MEDDFIEESGEQNKDSSAPWLRPWHFKKGQSGNPSGMPKGYKSLKTRAKEYLQGLGDDEAIEYFNGLNKLDVWKMAEGNPETKTDVKINKDVTFTEEELAIAQQIIAKRLSDTTTQTSSGETVE